MECIGICEILDCIGDLHGLNNYEVCSLLARQVVLMYCSHRLCLRGSLCVAYCGGTHLVCIAIVRGQQAESHINKSLTGCDAFAIHFQKDHFKKGSHLSCHFRKERGEDKGI